MDNVDSSENLRVRKGWWICSGRINNRYCMFIEMFSYNSDRIRQNRFPKKYAYIFDYNAIHRWLTVLITLAPVTARLQ